MAPAADLPVAFAQLCRTLAVYPPEHPRAHGAADRVLTALHAHRGPATVAVVDGVLRTDLGNAPASPHGDWLMARLREAAVRGIVLEPACTADDLLKFAGRLVAARQLQRTGETELWPADHARLRVLPLRFHGSYDGQGTGPAADDDVLGAASAVPASGLAALALRFFARDDLAPAAADTAPTGRPEDRAIAGDLDAMIAEFTGLPPTSLPQLPAAATGAVVARDLLGAYLHLFAQARTPAETEQVGKPLRRVLAALGADAGDLLDVYLQGARRTLPLAPRLQLLGWAVAAGQHELVARRGWLDVPTLVQGFPHVLPLALQVLAGSPNGLQRLHTALELVAQSHGRMALQLALGDDLVQDAKSLPLLLAIGEPVAGPAFARALALLRPDLLPVLIAHARTFPAAEPEQKALTHLAADDPSAAAFLAALATHAATRPVPPALRAQTGEILRRRVQLLGEPGCEAAQAQAVADLAHVPEERTRRLLRALAGRAWLPGWFDPRAGVKAVARRVLAAMEGR